MYACCDAGYQRRETETMRKNENDGTNHFAEFMIGIAMAVAGIIILLMNIRVSSFGFYRIGNFSSAPVLVLLFIFFLIWAVIRGKLLQWILVAADILCIIISVILGTNFYFNRINAFTLLVMLGLFAIGTGLILKNVRYLDKK